METQSADFRRGSNLIQGLFRAIPKSELRESHQLALHILSLADSLKPAHVVQKFTEAIIRRSTLAVKAFNDAMRELTLSDYANIQHLSLRADGHPLGDYMCWLFSGFVSDVWFGVEIATERRVLDAFDFERMVPSPTVPSGQLTKIYHAAVFDMGLGVLENHPHATASASDALTHPKLALGDIFLKNAMDISARTFIQGDAAATPDQAAMLSGRTPDAENRNVVQEATDQDAKHAQGSEKREGSNVGMPNVELPKSIRTAGPEIFVVVNAQCDLALSPSQKREIQADRSILLIPGYVHPLSAPASKKDRGALNTPLFVHPKINGGDGAWIEWNLRALLTIPYGEFGRWCGEAGHWNYERIGRIRPMNALALQRVLSEQNTRVGLPVTPPIYQRVTVTLQIIEDRKVIETREIPQARLILTDDTGSEDWLAFTTPFLQAVRGVMSERLNKMKDGGGGTRRLEPEDIEAALAAAAEWQKLLVPFPLKLKRDPLAMFNELMVIDAQRDPQPDVRSSKTIVRLLIDFAEGALE